MVWGHTWPGWGVLSSVLFKLFLSVLQGPGGAGMGRGSLAWVSLLDISPALDMSNGAFLVLILLWDHTWRCSRVTCGFVLRNYSWRCSGHSVGCQRWNLSWPYTGQTPTLLSYLPSSVQGILHYTRVDYYIPTFLHSSWPAPSLPPTLYFSLFCAN